MLFAYKRCLQKQAVIVTAFFVASYFWVTNPRVLLECPTNYAIPFLKEQSQTKGKVISCANIYISPIRAVQLV